MFAAHQIIHFINWHSILPLLKSDGRLIDMVRIVIMPTSGLQNVEGATAVPTFVVTQPSRGNLARSGSSNNLSMPRNLSNSNFTMQRNQSSNSLNSMGARTLSSQDLSRMSEQIVKCVSLLYINYTISCFVMLLCMSLCLCAY